MEIFNSHPHWPDVKKICTRLRENGFTAWLAGGCVRDGLMGIIPKDFDIATNARPGKVESLFNKTVDVGKAFGVIKVVVPSGNIEVATFRRDGNYTDGRRPDSVELSTPEEDAKRRDFTVNALFYDIFDGEVRDFVEGTKDLQARIIRTVGIAQDRFMEDKLRILRAVRFVAQLDFDLEQITLDAVCQGAHFITQVSWERITDELSKLITGKRPDRGLRLLKETSLLDVLFPEMTFLDSSIEFYREIAGDAEQKLLGWLFLISMIPADDKRQDVFKRLKFSTQWTSAIENSLEIATSFLIFDRLNLADRKKIAAEKYASVAVRFLEIQDELPEGVKDFVMQNPNLSPRFIEAGDILALGVAPGKEVGRLLERVYDEQLEGRINNKSDGLTWLKKQIAASKKPE